MKVFNADLHIHTVLSPCGSLEMSPKAIVQAAFEKKLDVIGITDHNTTRQCKVVDLEAKKLGLTVYYGAEVTTKEEVHCLAFFENFEKLDEFQNFLEINLPEIENNTDLFGYQIVVNEKEDIVYEEKKLLISALNQSIDQVEQEVHRLQGVFIPAHVNRSKNSLISQLGFVPADLKFDALELSKHVDTETFIKTWPDLRSTTIVRNSDAHQPETIGESFTRLKMQNTDFSEFRMALKKENGREVISL